MGAASHQWPRVRPQYPPPPNSSRTTSTMRIISMANLVRRRVAEMPYADRLVASLQIWLIGWIPDQRPPRQRGSVARRRTANRNANATGGDLLLRHRLVRDDVRLSLYSQTEKTCDQYYHDHHADDVEDVHCVVLRVRDAIRSRMTNTLDALALSCHDVKSWASKTLLEEPCTHRTTQVCTRLLTQRSDLWRFVPELEGTPDSSAAFMCG
jgi:hypothetical protein